MQLRRQRTEKGVDRRLPRLHRHTEESRERPKFPDVNRARLDRTTIAVARSYRFVAFPITNAGKLQDVNVQG